MLANAIPVSFCCGILSKGTADDAGYGIGIPAGPNLCNAGSAIHAGDSILVALIFNKEGNVQYYVPEGKWTNLLTNESVLGGRWVNEHHDFTTLPVLVKPNTLLAIGHENSRPDYDYADQVALHLFELGEGQQARTIIVNTSGEEELTVTASRKNSVITVKAEGAVKPWSIVLRGIHEAVQVEEGSSQSGEQGVIITPASSGQQELTIHLG